jgi:hypothetical protein
MILSVGYFTGAKMPSAFMASSSALASPINQQYLAIFYPNSFV